MCFPEVLNPNLGCGTLPPAATAPGPKGGLWELQHAPTGLRGSPSSVRQRSIAVSFSGLRDLFLFMLGQALTSAAGKANGTVTCFVASGSQPAQVRALLTNSKS